MTALRSLLRLTALAVLSLLAAAPARAQGGVGIRGGVSFTRLGLWQDPILSNLASEAAARGGFEFKFERRGSGRPLSSGGIL